MYTRLEYWFLTSCIAMLFYEKFYPILIYIWQFDSSTMFDTSICSRLFPHYTSKRIPTTLPCCQLMILQTSWRDAAPRKPLEKRMALSPISSCFLNSYRAPHHELSTYFIIFQLEEIPFSLAHFGWWTDAHKYTGWIRVDVSWISSRWAGHVWR